MANGDQGEGQHFVVTLLALNGKEKEVIMNVTREGVQLVAASDGKEFNRFPFEIIKKWLPAHLRSRNPGPDNCMDLQIHTDKGARDLRMRCADADTVLQVIEALRSTVTDILRDSQKAARQGSGMAAHDTPPEGSSTVQPASTGGPGTGQPPASSSFISQGQVPVSKQQDSRSQAPQGVGEGGKGGAAGGGRGQGTAAGGQGHRTMMSATVGRLPQEPSPEVLDAMDAAGVESRSAPGSLAATQQVQGSLPQTQDLSSLRGAIPITVLGTLPSPGAETDGFGASPGSPGQPGVTQIILAAAPTSALPQALTFPNRDRTQLLTNRLFDTIGLDVPTAGSARIHYSPDWDAVRRSQGASEGVLRQGSFGPAYMNAAYGSAEAGGSRSAGAGGGRPASPTILAAAINRLAASEAGGSPTAAASGQYTSGFSGTGGSYGSQGAGQSNAEDALRERALDLVMAARMSPTRKLATGSIPGAAAREAAAGAFAGQGLVSQGHAPSGQAASLQAELQEVLAQNGFLESMVKRLTSELALKHAAAGPEGMAASAAAADQEIDDGVPLPVWLKDRRALNPLLLAYDEKITDLERDAAHRTAALSNLQKQVEAVISENESLRAELGKALDSKAVMAAMAEGAAGLGATSESAAAALLREEAHLLRQENELLVAQQAELDGEMQRLHTQLAEQASQSVAMTQANAVMMTRVQQQVSGAQAVEARHAKLQAALTAAESKVALLTQQLAEAHAQLEDERINAETASRTLSQLQAAQGALKSESVANAQAARTASDQHAVMQAELVAVRERYDSVCNQLSRANKECEELRATLGSMDEKLTEYQHRDAEAYSRIREAVELAEHNRSQRDAAITRQSDLEREVEALSTRLANVRQVVHDQVYSDLQSSLHSLRAELDTTKEALRQADKQASEYKAAAERSARDCASLGSELEALKEDLGETLSSKSKVTLMTLTTMDRIQEVERERDEATQALDSMRRQYDRAQRDWALERHKLEAELRSVRKALVDRESAATLAGSEAAGLARQVDALAAELAAARDVRVRSEAELRQQLAAARAERDQEVKAMAARLEAALAAAARSVADAERMIDSKDSLLARWKEEATMVAVKMERALTDHKHDVEAREAAVEELRAQLQALHASHGAAVAELEELRAVLPGMQAALQESESRNAQLHMQLLASNNREEEMAQEVRSLQGLLERARFESKRGPAGAGGGAQHAQHDELLAKFKALREGGIQGDGIVDVTAMLAAPS